jgi:hypothetical protein
MMNKEYFLKYSQTYGHFDLDGASDNDGLNSQVAEDLCCTARAHFRREIYGSTEELGSMRHLTNLKIFWATICGINCFIPT